MAFHEEDYMNVIEGGGILEFCTDLRINSSAAYTTCGSSSSIQYANTVAGNNFTGDYISYDVSSSRVFTALKSCTVIKLLANGTTSSPTHYNANDTILSETWSGMSDGSAIGVFVIS